MTAQNVANRVTCEMMNTNGGDCHTTATWRLTRIDGTSSVSCTYHYNRLMKLYDRRPELFAPLQVGKV